MASTSEILGDVLARHEAKPAEADDEATVTDVEPITGIRDVPDLAAVMAAEVAARASAGADLRRPVHSSNTDTIRLVTDELAAAPVKYGRYFVLEQLGAGGMGMVYRAYDPKLCREVALKVLRPDALDADAKARMFREARAMAQLSHPNVLPVYDVEDAGDTVFITMELVRGANLGEWVKQAKPSYRAVLEVFRDAARGLGAAHAHGMVHRDFKLANVLIGEDGRVRVMDFGLAKASDGAERVTEETPVRIDLAPDGVAPLRSDLTQNGVVMGTPAYMAPEQFTGRPATPASDQYAFCVGLFEALYGFRPFKAKNFKELARLKKKAPVPLPPEDSEVPRWIHEVVVRGLHPDPAQRYASMEAMVDALRIDSTVKLSRTQRRRTWIGGGALLAAGLGIGLGLLGFSRGDRCASQVEDVDALWTMARREELQDAFVTAARGDKGGASVAIEAISSYVDALRGSVRSSCEAAVVQASVPEKVYARQLTCYAERRRDLAALLEVFEDPDDEMVRNVVDAVAGLEPVAPCEDEAYVLARPVRPSGGEEAQRIELTEERLARAVAQERAARYAPALAMLDGIGVDADEIGYVPLQVDVSIARGRVLAATDRLEAARRVLMDAYFAATESSLYEQSATAAREMAYLEGHTLRDYSVGELWLRSAGVSTRLGPNTALLQAELAVAEANVLEKAGRFREAQGRYETARRVFTSELGPEHPRTLRLTYNCGNMLRELGQHADGERMLREALEGASRVLGDGHPLLGRIWNALGSAVVAQGRYEDGAEMHRRAGAIFEIAFGPEHQLVAVAALDEAVAYSHLGDVEKAIPAYDKARRIFAAALGPDHPNVAAVLNNTGAFYSQIERYVDAQPYFEQALTLAQNRLGDAHPDVADAHGNLGLNLCRQGSYSEGIEHIDQSVSLLEQALGATHPRVAQAHVNWGFCLRRARQPKDAISHYARAAEIRRSTLGAQDLDYAAALSWQGKLELEVGRLTTARDHLGEVVAIYDASPRTPVRTAALARFDFARAAWASGQRDAARQAVRRARTDLAGLPQAKSGSDLAAVSGWMELHDIEP